jgi:hypothetical protein
MPLCGVFGSAAGGRQRRTGRRVNSAITSRHRADRHAWLEGVFNRPNPFSDTIPRRMLEKSSFAGYLTQIEHVSDPRI